jgi:hypothetical protein
MAETTEVQKHPDSPIGTATLYVELPEDLAIEAHEAEQESPGFLMNVLRYGVLRRKVYRHLRDHQK